MLTGKQARTQKLQIPKITKPLIFYLQSGEQGFTIIESLMAIVVVGILLVGLAPVFSLSVATRVQSRRVELATQATRSYIDALRSGKIAEPPATDSSFTATSAPTATGTLTCTANSPCTVPVAPTGTSLYCVDFDSSGTCEKNSVTDMIVQAFRDNASSSYALGIRVYRADAFSESTTFLKNTSTTKNTQNTFTGGIGQRTAPLLEITTEMNDAVPQYSDLCTRLGGCN